MKSVKWMYVSAMAIAFGMLSFATVACHDDDDDPKPAEGEVIETPKPVVEYYIKGAVTVKGCLLYTSPSPRDRQKSRMPSSA